jgi:uncharacterized protein YmfQ (DUF2313 family)
MKFKTLNEIYYSIVSSLPQGRLFKNAKNKETVLGSIIYGLAKCLNLVQVHTKQLYEELSIRLSTYSLDRWELFLGVYNKCSPTVIGTVEDRRARLIAKLQANNPQTAQDFLNLITGLGFNARLQPAASVYSPMTFPMTFPIIFSSDPRFTVIIHLNATEYAEDNTFLYCILNQYLPANVVAVTYETPDSMPVNTRGENSFSY